MATRHYPTIKPTPLKGTLKKEDIIRAVEVAKAARLRNSKEEGQKRRPPK